MKTTKKIVAGILMLVLALGMLTACGDPVATELEDFLNVQMVEVNANYEEIKAEAATWAEFETEDQFVTSIKDNLIPTVDENLGLLSKMAFETEEVKALRDKFIAVMEAYKAGFEKVLAGVENLDEEAMNEGNVKLEEGLTLLNEYNAALEALAEEKGMTIEY